ncbi:MAG: hypothetical protein IJ035_02305 [Oscillospiraceae bacterium]|nr:hypothetical protein [Oscillospiraceae bacterium]
MEDKKHGFWFVLFISILIYAVLKLLRSVIKILFGAVWLTLEFSLFSFVPLIMWAAVVTAAFLTVKLSGRVSAFPLAVLAVELAYDIKTAIKSSGTLSAITEKADSLGWFDETVMAVIGSIGEGGRILYIIYCFLNSFVLFGLLLLLSAVVKVILDKRKKKAENDTMGDA